MRERKFLVRYSDNWADEMDLTGFSIHGENELNGMLDKLEERLEERPFEFCVGTNEFIEYNSYPDAIAAFELKEITDEEEKMLIDLFKLDKEQPTFGFSLYSMVDQLSEG